MAHYLLRINDVEPYRIVEADNASWAVWDQDLESGTVEVWTLRSGEPRVYQITTESVRTVRRVE